MLGISAYRLKAEQSKYSLQMFSVFNVFFSMLFLVCLTTAGLPMDFTSVILTAMSPQVMVMIINYLDGFVFKEGFARLSKSFNRKMMLQLTLSVSALLILNLVMPHHLLVWPSFSFETLCAPMVLFIMMPEIFYQNSQFNEEHTQTLSIIYGFMSVGSLLLMGMSAYTVVLTAMAVTGLFWNSRDTFEAKSISWQSIAVTSIFLPAGSLLSAAASCVIGIGSAKAVDVMVREEVVPRVIK